MKKKFHQVVGEGGVVRRIMGSALRIVEQQHRAPLPARAGARFWGSELPAKDRSR